MFDVCTYKDSKMKIALNLFITALQDRRSRVWFPMVSLEFFIDIFLPAALWPWGWRSL